MHSGEEMAPTKLGAKAEEENSPRSTLDENLSLRGDRQVDSGGNRGVDRGEDQGGD